MKRGSIAVGAVLHSACWRHFKNGFLLLVALLGVLASAAHAQNQGLGPDDVLSVTVLTFPELSVDSVTVSPSGTVNLPVAGQIKVTGLSTVQVARIIAQRLNARVVNPEVTVALKQAGARRVFVLGAVEKPGVYEIKPGWRISEALAATGGVVGRADENRATLSRATQPTSPVDLVSVLGNPSAPQNRALRPGDVIVVTADPRYVTVSGDVVKPDIYPLRRAPRLLDVLVAAGGLRQPGRESRGYLLRRGQRVLLDVTGALNYTDASANVALQAGDLVMVEAVAPLNITVNGLVKNPGNYPLPEGSGVLQAIAQAGGQTTTIERAAVSVRRGAQLLPVNLSQAAFDPNADIRLRSGDLVQVNEPQIIRVQATGQVKQPGELRIEPDSTVLAAIARAGGLNLAPEAARISVVRQVNGRQIAIDVDAVSLVEGRDPRQNARLQEGDILSVTNVRTQVAFVSGEVARPGAYDLKEGEGVSELVARAGGQTAAASLRRVQVERGGKTFAVDVLGALRQGRSGVDFPLQEGDFVVVPQNPARVLVTQEVNRPGYVYIPEDQTLTIGEALAQAGGPRDRAKLGEIILFRRNAQGLKPQVVQLDKLQKGDLGVNQTLAAGDIVYVPTGRPSRSRSALDSIVSSVGTLRFLGVY